MLKIFTTLTAIGTVMLSPAFIGGASAQNVEIEIKSEQTLQDEDTLNYFASGAERAKEQAAAKAEQMIEGPAVPARELQYLPESVEIGGQGAAKVKIIDGRLVTETVSSPQAAPSAAPAPSQQPTTTNASEAPKTLNQQLQQKHGNVPQQPTAVQPPATPVAPKPAPAVQPAPAPVQTATPENAAAATEPASGAGVGHSAVVDRAKGAKINIISNTDTGVTLGQ